MMNVKDNIISDQINANYHYNAADNAKAIFVFAHGAGANMNHSFMEQFTALLLVQGISVLRFNFPFMDKRALDGKRYPPDRMPKLVDCYNEVLSAINCPLPLFIGGKSMGSRVAVTIAGDSIAKESIPKDIRDRLKGVICVGYPFHPAKKPESLRLPALLACQFPVLIAQGDRDLLGNETEIGTYVLPQHIRCTFLPDGDHDLKPRVKSGYTHEDNLEKAVISICEFIDAYSD